MQLLSVEAYENARSRDLVGIICDHCAVAFYRTKNDTKHKDAVRPGCRRFCSKVCQSGARTAPRNNCKQCGLIANAYRGVFCSHSCAAIFNNLKRQKQTFSCLQCGSLIGSKRYCSHKCQWEHIQNSYLADWLSGKRSGMAAAGEISSTVRRYIFAKYGRKCTKCGWCEINSATGRVPVQIDHIDGNFRNCSEGNLTVLCPNCHSLTPTYMNLNRGRGRDVAGFRRKKKDAEIVQMLEHIPGMDKIGVGASISAP